MKKSVLIIATTPLQHDGITKVIFDYLKYADKRKYKIDIACGMEALDEYVRIIKGVKCSYFILPKRDMNIFSYVINLAILCRKKKYDLVHIHGNSSTMFFDLFGAFLGGVKTRIVHSHNTMTEYLFVHKLLRPFLNLLLTKGIACSCAAGEWLFDKKYTVVLNGIDVDKFEFDIQKREITRKKYGLEGKYVIGHVGRFSFQKNQEFLLDILSEMIQKNNNIRLIMIGDGINHEQLSDLVKKKRLESYIIHINYTENVNELMDSMDVFVLPSRYEGLPIVAIEAQASGLPCVLSDSITRETKVINNCFFLSLDNKEEWISKVLCFEKYSIECRKKAAGFVRKAGFDINNFKKIIDDIWDS